MPPAACDTRQGLFATPGGRRDAGFRPWRRGQAMRQGRLWRGARTMVLLVPMVMTLLWAGAGAVSAATLTVCPSGCQYSQIGPAVAAASNGDTIQVGPGTYQGGITIDVSVK